MKLTRTNIWKWRDGEKSYKQYTQLAKQDKEEYLNYLLSLKPDILGENDWYILRQYAPDRLPKEKKQQFLEL